MDPLNIIIITIYLLISVTLIVYNHLRAKRSNYKSGNVGKSVAASANPPMKHSIVIILGNISDEDAKNIIMHVTKLVKEKVSKTNTSIKVER